VFSNSNSHITKKFVCESGWLSRYRQVSSRERNQMFASLGKTFQMRKKNSAIVKVTSVIY
jgi:hypothetical protein